MECCFGHENPRFNFTYTSFVICCHTTKIVAIHLPYIKGIYMKNCEWHRLFSGEREVIRTDIYKGTRLCLQHQGTCSLFRNLKTFSASQDTCRITRKSEIHHRIPTGTTMESVLSRLNMVQCSTPSSLGCIVQGGSNMTGTDLCVNKPHCAAAVRPWGSEATTSTLPPARVRTSSVLSGSC